MPPTATPTALCPDAGKPGVVAAGNGTGARGAAGGGSGNLRAVRHSRPGGAAQELAARAAMAGLAVVMGTGLVAFFVFRHRASVVRGVLAGGPVDLASVRHADSLVRASTIASAIALLVCGALFIWWLFHLARLFARSDVSTIRYRPGRAIGGWFVPFLNLARPKQVVDDLWKSSATWPDERRPASFVHLWWASFLLANVLSRVADTQKRSTASTLAAADNFTAWTHGLDLVAAVLALCVVVALTRRCQLRATTSGWISPGPEPR